MASFGQGSASHLASGLGSYHLGLEYGFLAPAKTPALSAPIGKEIEMLGELARAAGIAPE